MLKPTVNHLKLEIIDDTGRHIDDYSCNAEANCQPSETRDYKVTQDTCVRKDTFVIENICTTSQQNHMLWVLNLPLAKKQNTCFNW